MGYRPPGSSIFSPQCAGGALRTDINASGTVTNAAVALTPGNWVSLEGISFSVTASADGHAASQGPNGQWVDVITGTAARTGFWRRGTTNPQLSAARSRSWRWTAPLDRQLAVVVRHNIVTCPVAGVYAIHGSTAAPGWRSLRARPDDLGTTPVATGRGRVLGRQPTDSTRTRRWRRTASCR